MKIKFFVLLLVCFFVVWYLDTGDSDPENSEPTTEVEWMIDSTAKNGKIVFRFNKEKFNREKMDIAGYCFRSDGVLKTVEASYGSSAEDVVGEYQFKAGKLIVESDKTGYEVYWYCRKKHQLVLKNTEKTIWLSRYDEAYISGFPDVPGHIVTEWLEKHR